MNELAEEFGQRWNRFWFTPAEARPLGWLRIAVGTLAVLHFLDVWAGLGVWYARDGALPPAAVDRILELAAGDEANYHYSYLRLISTSRELTVVHVAAVVAAAAFAAGLFTRVTGVLTLVALLAYVHRAPMVAGHLEPLLAFLVAYLCIGPSGACLSLDQLLRKGARKHEAPAGPAASPPGPSLAANISLRLIQVHVAMFYAMMGLNKLYGDAWWDGMAVWLLIAQTESRPLDLTGVRALGDVGEYFLNFWTHAIVYYELALPVLIWNRFMRPVLLALAPLVWLSLAIVTGLVLFCAGMCAASMAFLAYDGVADANKSTH